MSIARLTQIVALPLFTACAVMAAASAKTPLDGAALVTNHTGVFNGETVPYSATVSEITLPTETDEPSAALSSIAYVRTDINDASSRPVVFIWNGGPSAASIALHMAGLGPKRLVIPADPRGEIAAPFTIEDSPHALLDIADLVFVDPVETGFSRLLKEEDRSYYYSTVGDAAAAAQYITAWAKQNGRTASPLYAIGTSYGSIRTVLVAGEMAKTETPLAGAVVFSQAVNLIESVQRKHSPIGYAVNMPQIAAIAHYHGRTAYQNLSVYELIDKAYDYFMSDYLAALVAGKSLTSKEQKKTAKQLEKFTGLSADYYMEHNLRVTKAEFRAVLFSKEELILESNDARYKAARENLVGNPPVKGASAAFQEYLITSLGAGDLAETYKEMAPDTSGWDYVGQSAMGGRAAALGAPRSVFVDYDWIASVSEAFQANAGFRLMIGTGVYDTLTTIGPARLLLNDPHLPADKVVLHAYEGGHSFYSNDAEYPRLANDLRDFLMKN